MKEELSNQEEFQRLLGERIEQADMQRDVCRHEFKKWWKSLDAEAKDILSVGEGPAQLVFTKGFTEGWKQYHEWASIFLGLNKGEG
jgi:hypothetical protein